MGVLGQKERIGFIEFVDNKSMENTVLEYRIRIRYYNKVFRNSDIYGVYPKNENLPNYVASIKWDSDGSPFGILTAKEKITNFENIENIVYSLKIKPAIYLYLILFAMLYPAIILTKLLLPKIKLLFESIYNNDSLMKKIAIAVMAIVMLVVFLKRRYVSSWDSINYVANGLSFLKFGKQLMTYPGTLFSIINTFLAELIFKNTQLSSFCYLQIIPLSITIMFTYKILRMFVSRNEAIIFLLFIFIVYSPLYLISDILIQPMTDGWLLMFCVLVAYAVMKEKVLIAGTLVAMAHYYRASQAIPILIFAIVLLPNLKIKKIIIYYASIICSVLLIQFILKSVFYFPNKDSDFYSSLFSKIPFTKLNIKDIFWDIINVFWAFKASTIPISISLIISLIGFIKMKGSNLRKLSIFSTLLFVVCFSGGLYIQKIFGSREETLTRIGENRYFIYALLFSTISAFIYLSRYFKENVNIVLNISKNVIIIFVITFSLYVSIKTITMQRFFKHIITFADYSNDYPEIEPNASYTIAQVMEGGAFNYILKNAQKYNGNYRALEDFLADDNSKFDYVLSTYSLADREEITDSNGIRFIKIWQSSLSNTRPYNIFKKDK